VKQRNVWSLGINWGSLLEGALDLMGALLEFAMSILALPFRFIGWLLKIIFGGGCFSYLVFSNVIFGTWATHYVLNWLGDNWIQQLHVGWLVSFILGLFLGEILFPAAIILFIFLHPTVLVIAVVVVIAIIVWILKAIFG